MDYLVLWFILMSADAPGGYIAPQEVRLADMQCGLDGAVVGIQVDRDQNPTTARFVDPKDSTKHCNANIRNRVMGLLPGRYHLAYTHMGSGTVTTWFIPDPHTSESWTRALDGTPKKPTNVKVLGQ